MMAFPMPPHEYFLFLIAVAALLGIGVGAGLWLAAKWRQWQITWRFERGRKGEEAAEDLLKQNGFQIVERQARGDLEYAVDGRRERAELFADYIAEKEGLEYLVEVKTGEQAVDPGYAPTRRQLLEYALAFETPNLMLLDMESREGHKIEFPVLEKASEKAPRSFWKWIGTVFLLGFLCGLFSCWRLLQK